MNIQIQSLTESQIQQVHEMTLQLLEGHGITMNGETVQETFKKHGAKVEGNRVHIPSKMVEDAIKSAPSEFLVTARDPKKSHVIGIGREPALVPTGGVPIVLDKNGDQDTATFDDFRNMLKLTHTSPILNFACSGSLYPTVPDRSDGILMMIYHTLLHTDKPLVGNCEGAAISNACIDMVERATGLGEDEHMVVAITNSISPMGWDGKMLDGIRTFAERNQPINITCCSMAGATAPIYLMGGIIQSNAEVLAGIVYSQLIRPGVLVIYGTTSSVMDMESMSLTIGTPEYVLISSACAQMAHYYGILYRSSGGLTDAKELDAQAGMESAMDLTFGLCEGVDFMLQSVGIYESFMSLGFDKWILDEEILARIAYIRKGLGDIPEELPEIIHDGVAEGNYLCEPSTLERV